MAYFANGDMGLDYEAKYCNRCIHGSEEGEGMHQCAVLELHFHHNYDECNKPDSFLHVLIPRNGIVNEQCRMFHQKPAKAAV